MVAIVFQPLLYQIGVLSYLERFSTSSNKEWDIVFQGEMVKLAMNYK